MSIFGAKPWVNPFGKLPIFPLFELILLIAQQGIFSFQNIIKEISWPILPKKKKLEKWPFFEQNHGLTPLEKCQFFDFLNFLFLQPRMAFFRSRISQNTFSWTKSPKKKSWKNGHFRSKTMGLPLWKNLKFFTFWTSCFYSLERRFICSRISKKPFS